MSMETTAMKLAESAQLTIDENEIEENAARKYFLKHKAQYSDNEMIAKSSIIEGRPTVQSVIHLARTIAVSTAVCEYVIQLLETHLDATSPVNATHQIS